MLGHSLKLVARATVALPKALHWQINTQEEAQMTWKIEARALSAWQKPTKKENSAQHKGLAKSLLL